MQPRGNHARVVEHEQVALPQQARQVAELAIRERTRRTFEVEQPAATALWRWVAGDQRIGQVEMEVGAPHRGAHASRGTRWHGPLCSCASRVPQDEMPPPFASVGGAGGTGELGARGGGPGRKPGFMESASGIWTSRARCLRWRSTSNLTFSPGWYDPRMRNA